MREAGAQMRGYTLISDALTVIDEKQRTVQLTFGSEFAAKQKYPFGIVVETLEMSERAANLDRLNAGGALLLEHDRKQQIGVVERAWIGSDKRAHAVVRFSQVGLGADIFTDVIDGIRKNVSFHYNVLDGDVTQGKRSGDLDRVNVTLWEATEISFVSVPADPTIGVGRSATEVEETAEEVADSTETTADVLDAEAQRTETEDTPITAPVSPEPVILTSTSTSSERGSTVMERETQILEMGKMYGAEDMARTFALDPNKSADDFRAALIEKFNTQEGERGAMSTAKPDKTAELGLSRKDVKTYSVLNAIRGIVSGKRDGFEFECSKEVSKNLGRPAHSENSFFVPADIQRAQDRINMNAVNAMRQLLGMDNARDLSATLGSQPGDGGALVGTDYMASAFIDVLRSKMQVMKLGARMLTGLVGNLQIPRQNGTATAYWVTEGVAPTESQQVFAQLSMSPRTVGAVTEFTRQLYLQSAPSIEQLVMADLAAVMARAIDKAIINGSGVGAEPKGILNQTGVSTIAPTGAGTPATFIYPNAVKAESDIEEADAPEGFAWLTRPGIKGTLKTRPLIEGSTFPVFMVGTDNRLNGYPVVTSTQVPADTLIFGDFTQILVAEWGVLELVANPYGTGFRAGNVEVRALQSIDVAVRYPQSFKKVTAFA
jgi:HK97 family phage major capsid protein